MTLDSAWKNCIKMWTRLIELYRIDPCTEITTLKEQIAKENGWQFNYSDYDCFFCQWANEICKEFRVRKDDRCTVCPARLIDKNFYCQNNAYHWNHHPEKFLKKILALYAQYKGERQ